ADGNAVVHVEQVVFVLLERARQKRLFRLVLRVSDRGRREEAELVELGDTGRVISAQVHEVELFRLRARIALELDAKPVDALHLEVRVEMESLHGSEPAL